MCLETHYNLMVSMDFGILHWLHLIFGNHTHLFCHAVMVGN